MLRYLERVGLIDPPRARSGYRLFGPAELQRLRTLRELVNRYGCGLSDVAFARRIFTEQELRTALERWFEAKPRRPAGVSADDWLAFEQEKHQRLIAA
jgi:DNA-binding transcriptional MerR regulator